MGHSKAFHPTYDEDEILQQDNTRAIEMIMDTYGDEIKRLVYTYMKNTADTDDVTQEVFVTIYQKLNMFQGKSSLKSWIYSIAINKCKDYLRSWHARNKRLKEKLTHAAHSSENTNETPEEYYMNQTESNQLLNQVMDLPIKYREVITLFYFKELSTKEIGQVLGMKEATVRTRLARGRDKLKECLSQERGGASHG
ncbi:sigma-70 family RNA polymerase sigma factor [Ornithinibacillus sp. L9]|uniref:RNA polymerase sigma factor n=1 Tax=Ornithinibacillus caprae TaxID=2678566 RepID=A0A6N8FJW4_9BACI|nr:sigma-70 family RNA polymerase sigma factor [Ornithinibacillus caprae]